jgi:hypothetical protein
MIDILKQPWPWYVAGPLIGLTVPLLLIIGNKSFGLSSSFRHICAMCIPSKIEYFNYDWKKELWNIAFVIGIVIGAAFAVNALANPNEFVIAPKLQAQLSEAGITDYSSIIPSQIMNWNSLFSLRGFLMIVVGGFLIGFGTRYGDGCTSGHAIMGLSNLQWPSLVATICFMLGGFVMSNLILPIILRI